MLPFGGVVISCTVFAVIGLFICFRSSTGILRILVIIILLIISTGVFISWYNSLYNGDNLETEYTWHYQTPSITRNLAYGKKNWLSDSAAYSRWTFPHASWHLRQKNLYVSRFVDGNRKSGLRILDYCK